MRGPTVLGVLAAALLVTALVITGCWQDLAGRPPAPAAGPTAAADSPYRLNDGYRCPLGRPVLAMADGHSYPPGHPARPPHDARPVACYQTPEEAAAAGYRPAPLPAGALVIGGVYLTRTDRAFRSGCQLAADRLGFAVPCPELLPTRPPGTAPPRVCERRYPYPCQQGLPFGLHHAGFQVPPGYLGVDKQPQGSLEISAAPAPKSTAAIDRGVACETERRIATVRVQGSRAVLVGCPGWSSSGQVTLRWTQSGVLISVNLQGASVVNQQLLIALAEHLRLVRPTT